MYYRLSEDNFMNFNQNAAVIYNLLTGEKWFFNREEGEIINELEKNIEIEYLYQKFGVMIVDKVINNMQSIGVGKFYYNKVYIEKLKIYSDLAFRNDSVMHFDLNSATIELTGQCNLNCKFCTEEDIIYRSCGCKKWSISQQDIIDWDKIIRDLIKLGIKELSICGGEPFLEIEKVKKIIILTHRYNINLTIYTNGTLIDLEIAKFIENYKNVKIILHFLSLNNINYDNITNSYKVLDKVLHGLQLLKTYNIHYTIFLLVGEFNELELEDIRTYFINDDFLIAYIYPTNPYCVKDSNNQEKLFEPKERELSVNINTYQLLLNYNSCLYKTIFISSLGEVFPCMMLRKYKLGDLNKEEISSIFRREDYKKFWKLSKNKVDCCKNCANSLHCFDCRALDSYATNKVTGMKYCIYIR